MKRLVILVSGNGTNLQCVIDAVESNLIDAKIAAIICNKKNAYAIERGKRHNILTIYAPYIQDNITRLDYDNNLSKIVFNLHPDLIILAGWLPFGWPSGMSMSIPFLDKCVPSRLSRLAARWVRFCLPIAPGSCRSTRCAPLSERYVSLLTSPQKLRDTDQLQLFSDKQFMICRTCLFVSKYLPTSP